ncbi:protein phosphatase [Edaphobacillus lindanitolerans]|uniref:Protein phosphatase n=1 Tax=Edaphobacillus lindanitolerans TaxID=550447 RepID=A0A1U7PJ27_9BACI|nr:protein phosphatase [Edaphobacillus lindanitolerans]
MSRRHLPGKRGIHLDFAVQTHVGMKRRVNEDHTSIFTKENGRILLAIVADGMGGHKGGDTASRMAVEGMMREFGKTDPGSLATHEGRAAWLTGATETLNRELYEYSRQNEECRGMGTTLEAAIVARGEVTVCHLGDSRTYLIRRDGATQLTKDHSLVNILLENGEITEEEAVQHPKRNVIMKALGTDAEAEPDIIPVELGHGTALLLCSDGLSNKLSGDEIADTVLADGTAGERADLLIASANERGGEDNISVILIDNEVREGDGR